MKYDYLVVGAGLFGATFANIAKENGKKVLVIDKREHIGGNVYTKNIEGINVHKYGAHIFHTDYREVWDYVNKFVEFNRYTNSPVAIYKEEVYNMPFNMNTFSKIWNDVITPNDAIKKIEEEKAVMKDKIPSNLEEQAIMLVGRSIYEKLVKGYTEKQWGRSCKELPPFIIKRLPVRFTYDNNYFNDRYQGIPIGGYTKLIEKMLDGIDIKLNEDYLKNKEYYDSISKKIIYTGMIDQFYDYKLGTLEYRSLRFESETLNINNYQGNAVINYTEAEVPYTRIIEHKYFEDAKTPHTVITREYPQTFTGENEPYYPINDENNNPLYKRYKELADKEKDVIFGGRLGTYSYLDMDDVIKSAMETAYSELK